MKIENDLKKQGFKPVNYLEELVTQRTVVSPTHEIKTYLVKGSEVYERSGQFPAQFFKSYIPKTATLIK